MRYVIALVVGAAITWPFLIWVIDGKFTRDVWITAAWIWGIMAVVAFITIVIQKKKLF